MFDKKEYNNKWKKEKRKNDPEWRAKQNTQHRLSYQKNRTKRLEYNKTNREKRNKINRDLSRNLRIQILNHYSNGDIKCNCCGEKEIHFLSLDHINNDGGKNRAIHGCGRPFYIWIRKNGFPPIFQVLCMNCNFAKGKIGCCPHSKKIEEKMTAI